MKLINYRLGDLIEPSDARNEKLKYSINDVKGISIQKVFIETKADMTGVSLKPYYLVQPDDFAYVTVTSRNGDKITIAHNDTNDTYIVSSSYVVFHVKKKDILLSDYLFMYFNRPEFDRYARFNSWGSTRETFSWDEMCDINIDLPPVDIQEKYVNIYRSLLLNQRQYETGLEDLKLLCTAHIEKLRRENILHRIGDYITPYNEKNSDGAISLEQGININKQFISPQRANSNLYGRKIVRHGMFAYCTQLNNENVAIAYRDGEDCVVSSVYDVFKITDPDRLLPQYLMLWLIRPEFGRFVYWASEGSSYEFLNYENLADYLIPVPSINVQRSIGDIYLSYVMRNEINEKLKLRIKDICPILIKGSIEEAS